MKNNIFKSPSQNFHQEKNNLFVTPKKDVNNFKSSQQKPSSILPPKPLQNNDNNIFKDSHIKTGFDLNKTNFPDINVNKNENNNDNNKLAQTNKSYVNIVNINKCIVQKTEVLKPGWVQIKMTNKGANVYEKKYGDKTKRQILQEQKQELESDINYTMNNAIQRIEDKRNKYIEEYNDLHGEGAYDELYVMKPIFQSDDESDEDNEIIDDEYSDSDNYIENE